MFVVKSYEDIQTEGASRFDGCQQRETTVARSLILLQVLTKARGFAFKREKEEIVLSFC